MDQILCLQEECVSAHPGWTAAAMSNLTRFFGHSACMAFRVIPYLLCWVEVQPSHLADFVLLKPFCHALKLCCDVLAFYLVAFLHDAHGWESMMCFHDTMQLCVHTQQLICAGSTQTIPSGVTGLFFKLQECSNYCLTQLVNFLNFETPLWTFLSSEAWLT